MAVSSVDSTTSDTQLLPSRSRKGLIIANTDANRLYVMLDSATASATAFSFYLDTGNAFGVEGYEGEVRGLWAADGSGAAKITEY